MVPNSAIWKKATELGHMFQHTQVNHCHKQVLSPTNNQIKLLRLAQLCEASLIETNTTTSRAAYKHQLTAPHPAPTMPALPQTNPTPSTSTMVATLTGAQQQQVHAQHSQANLMLLTLHPTVHPAVMAYRPFCTQLYGLSLLAAHILLLLTLDAFKWRGKIAILVLVPALNLSPSHPQHTEKNRLESCLHVLHGPKGCAVVSLNKHI